MVVKPIIGVIGAIGAGKTAVANAAAALGGHLISADALGHDGLRDPAVKAQVVARWGDTILKPDGEIDRRKLGGIVFTNPAERAALEGIQFPYIGGRVMEEIAKAEADPKVRFVILDAAVLLEAGWKEKCDRVLFVDAPRSIRLERLKTNRGWSEAELDRREASQWPLAEKRKAADAVLVNDGSVADAARAAETILQPWIRGAKDDTALPGNVGE